MEKLKLLQQLQRCRRSRVIPRLGTRKLSLRVNLDSR